MPVYPANKRFRDFALAHWDRCQWCNRTVTRETATTDHVKPMSKGGSHNLSNLVLSCRNCNQSKADRPADRLPYGPRWNTWNRGPKVRKFYRQERWFLWYRVGVVGWVIKAEAASTEKLAKARRRLEDGGLVGVFEVLPHGVRPGEE